MKIPNDEKIALITGASSGIGKAVAVRLAQEGIRAAITARDEKALHATACAVERAGSHALCIP